MVVLRALAGDFDRLLLRVLARRRYVNDVAFSPNGGYIASGNDKGQVLLYSLTHYGGA